MAEPAEVSTAYSRPLARRLVVVKSKERVTGRRIAYDEVFIYYSRWVGYHKDEKAKQVNGFWANPPYMTTCNVAEIRVSEKAVRVRMSEEITLEVAERVFNAFASRKLRFQRSSDERKLGGVESWEPAALEYDKELKEYEVSFCKPAGLYGRVKLVGEDVVLIFGPQFETY